LRRSAGEAAGLKSQTTGTSSPADHSTNEKKQAAPTAACSRRTCSKPYVGWHRRRRQRRRSNAVSDQYPHRAPPSTVRHRLANRRSAVTFDFGCGQHRYTATVGYFVDGPLAGRLAEIFLSNGRAGSDLDAAARDSAVLCSLALQHGADIDTLR